MLLACLNDDSTPMDHAFKAPPKRKRATEAAVTVRARPEASAKDLSPVFAAMYRAAGS